jgi:hypothetical protein
MSRRAPGLRPILLALLLATGPAAAWPSGPSAQSRRIVDVVLAGDAKSEREHDYAGEGVATGTIGDRTFRQASGWLRFTLRTYDDTEVTLACLCRGSDGRRLTFELLVDGQSAGVHSFESPSSEPVLREYPVPERLTHAKGRISVELRGVGGPTPGIIELRTVQEHLE